jgi:hypothetical protein
MIWRVACPFCGGQGGLGSAYECRPDTGPIIDPGNLKLSATVGPDRVVIVQLHSGELPLLHLHHQCEVIGIA